MHLKGNLSIRVNFTIEMSEISIENTNFRNKKCCSYFDKLSINFNFLSEILELTLFLFKILLNALRVITIKLRVAYYSPSPHYNNHPLSFFKFQKKTDIYRP